MHPNQDHLPAEPATAPRRKPRILFIINSLSGGGAERVMAQLLSLSEPWRADHAISLALLDDEARAYPIPDWVDVHQLDCRHRTASSIAQLRHLVRALDPDVTLSFLTRANIASAFAAAGRGKPWIISERINTTAHLGHGLRGLLTGALVRRTYRRASRIICVSGGVAQALTDHFGVAPEQIDVIANPVDVGGIRAAASASPELVIERPYVLALGRLVPAKNHALLLEAFARSAFTGRLVIAGEGPERARLADLAAQLGIGDRLILPGFLAYPYPVLSRAEIFALSSNAEGFPNALVEALALGVPVVATNCRDGPADILAGKAIAEVEGLAVAPAGILSPVGDVESYARALDLAADPAVRRAVIAGGAQRVTAYLPQTSVERYWAVIQGQLARSAPYRAASAPRAAD